MTLLLEPNDIANSRPPDRVVYTDWEPDPTDDNPPEETRFVAERWTLFKVMTYALERRVFLRERRKRMEYWDQPAVNLPVLLRDDWPLVNGELLEAPTEVATEVIYRHIPAATVGRWEWEYRRRWHVGFLEGPKGEATWW